MKKPFVVGFALIVACAAFLPVRAGAQPAIMIGGGSQYVTFGMVGLSTGQTTRLNVFALPVGGPIIAGASCRSEEHTSELQSRRHLVCRLLLEKKQHITPSMQTNISNSKEGQHDLSRKST